MNHINKAMALLCTGAAMALALAENPDAARPTIGRAGDATIINTPAGNISVTPISGNIFRIARLQPGTEQRLPESRSAILSPSSDKINVFLTPEEYTIVTPAAKLRVNRHTGEIRIFSPSDSLLCADLPQLNPISHPNSISLLLPKGNYYGTGERGHSLTLNNDSLSLYNRQNYGYTDTDSRISQMGISVPYVVSDAGIGVLFDDFAKAAIIPGDTLRYISESPNQLSYYLLAADSTKSVASVTSEYTRLTGRQPLPPLWALGYITSKYGYHNESETLGVIDTLHNEGYPVDGIVLDLYWYGKETDMGRLEWMPTQWPDPAGMLAHLKEKGVNTVLITQPYINKIGAIENYNTLDSLGLLTHAADGSTHDVTTWVGEAGMFDVSNPATKEWLWNRLRPLTAQGVAGWWGDLGEPEVHPSTILHHNGLTAEQYHNQYGNDWSEIIYNGLRNDFADKRPLLMMRGGTAGLQRYGVMPWTTDVSRTWGGLQPQVKLMLSSGLSGLAYMSSDLGGFAVEPSQPDDPELYARWLQMGAFTPVMRTHAQKNPEPYHFPTVADISRKYIRMRYQWLPYNYSLAMEATLSGYPLARTLNFHSGTPDSKVSDIADEYLWGKDILVAPVLEKGARKRKVTFPDGEWYSWWKPTLKYNGNTTHTVAAPLDEIPIFVRGGSFVPQYEPEIRNTSEYNPSYLTLRYFPAADRRKSTYTMYEDDRQNPKSIEKGEYQTLKFSAQKEKGNQVFEFESNGTYPGRPATRSISLQIENQTKAPSKVLLRSLNGVMNTGLTVSQSMHIPQQLRPVADGNLHTPYTYHYNGQNHTLTICFPWGYSPTRIEIIP